MFRTSEGRKRVRKKHTERYKQSQAKKGIASTKLSANVSLAAQQKMTIFFSRSESLALFYFTYIMCNSLSLHHLSYLSLCFSFSSTIRIMNIGLSLSLPLEKIIIKSQHQLKCKQTHVARTRVLVFEVYLMFFKW